MLEVFPVGMCFYILNALENKPLNISNNSFINMYIKYY